MKMTFDIGFKDSSIEAKITKAQQIAEIQNDACNDSFDDWTAISCGLVMVSKLMQEDIDGRKEGK